MDADLLGDIESGTIAPECPTMDDRVVVAKKDSPCRPSSRAAARRRGRLEMADSDKPRTHFWQMINEARDWDRKYGLRLDIGIVPFAKVG